MAGERGFGAFVPQVVAHVREERAPGVELLHQLQRLFDGGVGGMRTVPQRVQKQHVQAAQKLLAILRESRCGR